jgi:hypothetical protein
MKYGKVQGAGRMVRRWGVGVWKSTAISAAEAGLWVATKRASERPAQWAAEYLEAR